MQKMNGTLEASWDREYKFPHHQKNHLIQQTLNIPLQRREILV